MDNKLKDKHFESLKSKKIYGLFVQFVKFGLVGVCNTIVMLSIYYLVLWINSDFFIVGNILGYMCGILCSYLLNSKFVFKAKDDKKHRRTSIIKVYVSYGITLLLQTLLLYAMVNFLFISEQIAPIINICITTPINFLLNKLWAFRNSDKLESSVKKND